MKFADTSRWAEWALPGDARHTEALAMVHQLGRSEQILTSNLVAGEMWPSLRRRDGHDTEVAFVDRLDTLASADRLVVQRVTADQESAAWEWLRRHDEREYSVVDATGFRSCGTAASARRSRSTRTPLQRASWTSGRPSPSDAVANVGPP